ncbi:serine/threonine-protein kinase [Lentzea flaviverrucosa]|uniref:non-specific serine/threonine protein kinase n=1 Tax=Lentzea flaviverrucosa TaxID=200379 RepID=A0A1H9SGX3_9PSEU|nr:serine/threonine-protein kinase [Lentzea flaviverrucosa]RDI25367.1 protein kinase-like protein [Lentzea flaviverrucosa]SER84222.1 serine/threonine protein kinase [Lentzea flaviverrucosa]
MQNVLGDHPRNNRSDYKLEARPLGEGGQARVYRGTHKATGVQVALKRLFSWGVDDVARMRREIDFGLRFPAHEHVMPVLDYGMTHEWFVMPLAQGNADESRAAISGDEELFTLVMAVCSALEVAHEAGWVHRDLKPANLLLLDGHWTVADWGFGRRPRGETTFTGRTAVDELFGTHGFAAPEQSIDAHEATASADFYSLGQIIGWARTGREPKDGAPLLPENEPWRSIVAAATRRDPSARPQNAQEFRELVTAVRK